MSYIGQSTTTLVKNCAILILPNRDWKMNNKYYQTSNRLKYWQYKFIRKIGEQINASINSKMCISSSYTLAYKEKCDEKLSMH